MLNSRTKIVFVIIVCFACFVVRLNVDSLSFMSWICIVAFCLTACAIASDTSSMIHKKIEKHTELQDHNINNLKRRTETVVVISLIAVLAVVISLFFIVPKKISTIEYKKVYTDSITIITLCFTFISKDISITLSEIIK